MIKNVKLPKRQNGKNYYFTVYFCYPSNQKCSVFTGFCMNECKNQINKKTHVSTLPGKYRTKTSHLRKVKNYLVLCSLCYLFCDWLALVLWALQYKRRAGGGDCIDIVRICCVAHKLLFSCCWICITHQQNV